MHPHHGHRAFRLVSALCLTALLASSVANAQASTPIQDNGFLIEEAYNQERGVVQTIQTFSRMYGSGDWVYTLTQEWPVPAETHQLSVTIPVQGLSGPIGPVFGEH